MRFYNWKVICSLSVLLLQVFCVVVLPFFFPFGENDVFREDGFWAAPSARHFLGTDDVGRDLFLRLLCGGRTSLLVGFCSILVSLLLGVPLGIAAGYLRGALEWIILRGAEVLQSFPSIIFVLFLVSAVGPSVWNIILTLGVLNVSAIARLVYSNTLSIREKPFIDAARLAGASTASILWHEILPNVIAPVWALLAFRVGRSILSESSLSFLGVGIRTPQASWGNLMQYASHLPVLALRPWVWAPPGICIAVTVISLNFLGEGLREQLDPAAKGERGGVLWGTEHSLK